VVEQVYVDNEISLRQFLASSPTAGLVKRRSALISQVPLEGAVAVVDAAQVALVGPVLQWSFAFFPGQGLQGTVALGALVAALTAVIRHALRVPGPGLLESADRAAKRAVPAVIAALFLAAAACTIAAGPLRTPIGFYIWILTWAVLSATVAGGLRFAADYLAGLRGGERVLVVGPGGASGPVALALAARRHHFAKRLTYCDETGLTKLREIVGRGTTDVVVLALAGRDAPLRASAVCDCLADQPVRILLAIDVGEFGGGWQGSNRLALVDLGGRAQCGWQGAVKRIFDLAAALALLVILAPILAAAAIAIWVETPGTVLFRQWRFGLGSQPFRVYKFRTMSADRSDPTGAAQTMARDPRVTRVGRVLRRTSIDELPQLLNVVRGEMSLVGPRPHPLHMRVGDTYFFDAVRFYRHRHVARPGITGWAQINGSRGRVDTIEKARRRIDLDLWYVQHWSLLLDLQILTRTALGGFLSMYAD
jgi:polysaccharide biosynthesis protein PslA